MKIIKNILLTAVAATLLLTSATRAADHRDHRDAVITITKHIPAFLPPGGDIFATVAGVVGGDIGEGTMTGNAFNPLEALPDGSITFEAEYRLVGSKHSLTLRFRSVQAPDKSGAFVGIVTDGWLKGNVLTGHYTARDCDQGVNLTCFDIVLTIKKGSKARN
jgi:hypothetical protein